MSSITVSNKQEQLQNVFVEKTDATAKIITPQKHVITVIGTDAIRSNIERSCIDQAINVADAPGVDEFVLNPDCHTGYGTAVGSVFSSRDMIYPGAVGPDVKCSMSFLQFNIPEAELKDKTLRRNLIKAIEERIPTGAGNHMPIKARPFDGVELLKKVAIEGASRDVLTALNIPIEWASLCEDASHGRPDELESRLGYLMGEVPVLESKLRQLGGIGAGNHFVDANIVEIAPDQADVAQTFGLLNGYVGFLNHFGSRGFGYSLTSGCKGWPGQFSLLADKFNKWRISFPGGDSHNVYVPVGTRECDEYLDDMNLGANFATVNHLLVCTYVMEAFKEVMGDAVDAHLVYYIAHNIIRHETVDKSMAYVHRKGATRAFPAGHHELKDTPFYKTGHPILLPGNPVDGSTIMVGLRGSRKALNSVNHGAGRSMSRKKASETFRQRDVDARFDAADILTNCRQYPIDECPAAYKPYSDVIESVELAGLAKTVAKLRPIINIKDNDKSKETSA
jgi:tRNA-splicing ligase RtcB